MLQGHIFKLLDEFLDSSPHDAESRFTNFSLILVLIVLHFNRLLVYWIWNLGFSFPPQMSRNFKEIDKSRIMLI